MNLPQTQEVVNAVALILRDLHDAKLDDGKISTPEIGTVILSNIGSIVKAIKDLGEIPKEIRALDKEALDTLYYGFLTTLDWQPDDHTRDKFATVYGMVAALITGSIQWVNTVNPPRGSACGLIMNILKIIVLKFLQEAFLQLSKADGKEGLSPDDFKIVVQRVVSKASMPDDGKTKSDAVSAWAGKVFEGKVSEWVLRLLVYVAYLFAKRKGVM